MQQFDRMLARHLPELLNVLRHRITNAVSEGLNSEIQSIESMSRGFRDFRNYRIRILFAAQSKTWQIRRPPTRFREHLTGRGVIRPYQN